MSLFHCGCKGSCTLFAIIASVVVGVVAGVLRYTAVITVTPAFLWVLFGIAVVYLLATTLFSRRGGCADLCPLLRVLLLSVLGTVLLSVVLLGVTFAATSVLGAVITGALLFAFSMTLATTACVALCIADCHG